MYCHRGLVSLVIGGTYQSLGTRLWMPVLGYVESIVAIIYVFVLFIHFNNIICDQL